MELHCSARKKERGREREREKKEKGAREKSLQGWGFAWECAWPAAHTMKTQRRGPHPALNHFSFPSIFYSRRRTSSYTRSWMGKHKVSSNVLQLNTVKKKKKRKKRRDYTSAKAFQRKWEWNRKGEEAPYFEDMLTLYLDVFGVWALTFAGML